MNQHDDPTAAWQMHDVSNMFIERFEYLDGRIMGCICILLHVRREHADTNEQTDNKEQRRGAGRPYTRHKAHMTTERASPNLRATDTISKLESRGSHSN